MSFFFYFLGYDSHDGGDALDSIPKKRKRVNEEEALLKWILKQQDEKPKLVRKLNKDTLRDTLERNFKGDEVKELLEVVALPQVVSARDLVKEYKAKAIQVENVKRVEMLMMLIMLDEGEENEQ